MNFPVKKTSTVFLTSAVCFTVLRLLQLFFCVDSTTGFFKKGYTALGSELSCIIFLFIFVCWIFSFSEKKVPKAYPVGSVSLSIAYIILAAFLVLDLIFLPSSYNTSHWQLILFYLSGIVTVVFLLISGVSFFIDIPFFKYKTPPFFVSIAPILFWIFRTIICFSVYTEIAVLSDFVFTIFSFLCIMFLTLYLSFLINGVYNKKTSRRLLPLFSVTICSLFCSCVPQLIFVVLGYKDRLHSLNINHITLFGILVFLIILYFNVFNDENLREKTKKHAKEASLFKH